MRTTSRLQGLLAGSFLVLATGALASGCGGTDNGDRPEPTHCRPIEELSDTPDPGSGPVDCSVLDGLEVYMLNNWETGSTRPGWYVNTDRTALQEPPPDIDPIPTEAIPGGRCIEYDSDNPPTLCNDPSAPRGQCDEVLDLTSWRAVHVRSGFLTGNGGVFGHKFPKEDCVAPNEDDPSTLCRFRPGPPEVGPCSVGEGPSPPLLGCNAKHDFSDWDGVLVWARKAPGSYTTIRVRVSDVRTDESACICNPLTNQNDTSDGCDKFGAFISLENDFQAFLIPFREMQQGGWGLSSPGLDTSELMEIGLEHGRGSWNYWIDDVAFYRSKR